MKSILIQIESEGTQLKTIALGEGEYRIGSDDCEIPLAYPTVSRRHGKLRITSSGVYYQDTSSRNGSALICSRGRRIVLAANIETEWPIDQRVAIGPFTLSWSQQEQRSTDDISNLKVRFSRHYTRLLSENPADAHDLFFEHVNEQSWLDAAVRPRLLELIHHEHHGDGPIRNYIFHPRCREILINSYDEIYVDTGEGLHRTDESFVSNETFEAWVQRKVHQAGRRFDLQNPICEATLENGARFHAVMPPISARGISVAIRRFGSAPLSESQALASGWLSNAALITLKTALSQKKNIIISGGTSSGKTSLLNFLCSYLPNSERIVTIEDTLELSPPIENLVQLQARKPNADGVGQISLRELVQCSLRMRPDRIIVGECRGAEVIEMLQAMNTGHPGSLTTIHANSTEEALHRLELLALLGATNPGIESIREWIRTSIDVIAHVERDSAGHRHVAEIAERKAHGKNRDFELVYKRALS